MKFKVGDTIKAISDEYNFTCKSLDFIGEVKEVLNYGIIGVRTVSSLDLQEIGSYHEVDAKYFELVDNSNEIKGYTEDETSTSIKEKIILLNKTIEDANNTICGAEKEIEILQSKCQHEDLEKHEYGTANCLICGKTFDWYCPTSPTLECDYEQEDGSYNDDCCRYCGCPEERK